MLNVAVVGCGKIADAHLGQLARIPACQVVAVCDREPLMAAQLAERFAVPASFTDVGEMLVTVRPDVVHITTPPAGHFSIARQCLANGAHVYVEKPFTLDAADAEELIDFANRQGLCLTAGHDDQFSHAARRLRTLVAGNYLGGGPLHMESTYGYELGGGYARALLADREHWVRRLPGKLLHNLISHGLARIAEYLADGPFELNAHGFASPTLRAAGGSDLLDELRLMVADGEGNTAYFTFSSTLRPALHQFRIYGKRNGALLDQDQETVIRLPGARQRSYLEQFVPPFKLASQYVGNALGNMRRFGKRDFHTKSGLKCLAENFYEAIRQGAAPPIPYREIILVARLMDEIFRQLSKQHNEAAPDERLLVTR